MFHTLLTHHTHSKHIHKHQAHNTHYLTQIFQLLDGLFLRDINMFPRDINHPEKPYIMILTSYFSSMILQLSQQEVKQKLGTLYPQLVIFFSCFVFMTQQSPYC